MKPDSVRFLTLAMVAGALALAPATGAAMVKCNAAVGSFRPPPAYILDGKRVESYDAVRAVDPRTIESLWVFCSNEGHRIFGVEPGTDVVVASTIQGRPVLLAACVQSIVLLQEAHLARTGSYARRMEELPYGEPCGAVAVTLRTSGDGTRWTATGRHEEMSPREPLTVSGSYEVAVAD